MNEEKKIVNKFDDSLEFSVDESVGGSSGLSPKGDAKRADLGLLDSKSRDNDLEAADPLFHGSPAASRERNRPQKRSRKK